MPHSHSQQPEFGDHNNLPSSSFPYQTAASQFPVTEPFDQQPDFFAREAMAQQPSSRLDGRDYFGSFAMIPPFINHARPPPAQSLRHDANQSWTGEEYGDSTYLGTGSSMNLGMMPGAEIAVGLNGNLNYSGVLGGTYGGFDRTGSFKVPSTWPSVHAPSEDSPGDNTPSASPKSFTAVSKQEPPSSTTPVENKQSPGNNVSWNALSYHPHLQQPAGMATTGDGIRMALSNAPSSLNGLTSMSSSRWEAAYPSEMAVHRQTWQHGGHLNTLSKIPYLRNGVLPHGYSQQNTYSVAHQSGNPLQANSLHRTLARASNSAGNNATQNSTLTPRIPDAQSKRKDEDQMLLECKKANMTYKQIREKLGTTVAESTLRGRYRALTKEKERRVRKPVWTERDVQLLRGSVQQQITGYDGTHSQRIAKISWKKASEDIVKHGGSYAFGNSTCKKKWYELPENQPNSSK